jgi:phosphonate transport system permease protein
MENLKRYKRYFFPATIFTSLFIGGAFVCKANLSAFLDGIPRSIDLLGFMVPPEWGAFPELLKPGLDTVEIAFLGTAFGAILSFFLGLLAAVNLTPRVVREAARGVMTAERALPDLIVILLFVAAVGLGPFPGVMALAVSSIGMLGKLFAEAIEEVDPKPLESMESVGATKSQIIRYAVLPQVMPSFMGNILYRFDINIRMSIFLGAVGAGGIGYELVMSMAMLEYRRMSTVIIVILVLVVLCEKTSNALRKRIIGQETLQ